MQGAARKGRPLTARQAAKEELVRVTLDETPEGAIMDQAASNRVFTLAPHFTAKLEDIAGLYFDPPARSFWTSIITFPLWAPLKIQFSRQDKARVKNLSAAYI